MHGFHVILHLVRPGELFAADRTREYLPLVALVVEERVPLEAVLVLKRLLYIELRALGALVNALGDRGVTKEIQTAYGHLRQLFRGVLGVRRRAASHTSLRYLATRRCGHRADLAAGRRRIGRWRRATASATTAVLRVVPTGGRRRRRTSRRRRGRRRAGTGRGGRAGGRR